MAFVSCMIKESVIKSALKYQKDMNKTRESPLVSKSDIFEHLLEKAGY